MFPMIIQTSTQQMDKMMSEVFRYPRNFLIELQVAFQKMKKQLVACGDTEKVDPIMAVVMLTWYLQTVGRC